MNEEKHQSSSNNKTSIQDLKGILATYLNNEGVTDLKHNFTCLNPNHNDKTPSMAYYESSKKVYCYGCHASWDIFDLFAVQHLHVQPDSSNRVSYPNGFKEVYNRLADFMNVAGRRFKISPEDAEQSKINDFNRKIIEIAQKNLNKTDYLKRRGISLDLANKFRIGFIPKWVNPTTAIKTGKELTPTPRLIIPTGKSSYLARDTRETVSQGEEHYIKQKQGRAHLFNGEALLDDSKPIFLVEGEFDALSILEVTDDAQAVALGSTSNIDLFCRALQQVKSKNLRNHQPYDPVFLIALDNDDAGIRASKELEARLSSSELGFDNYTVNIAKDHKDANEALTSDRAKFTSLVNDRIKDPDNYLANLLQRIAERKDTPQYIPTGFSNLDKILDGGLYPQLYVLGAVSSVGKTTFVMQVADRIAAKQQKPIFYFSLETSKDELTEKNLSRLSYELADQESGSPQTARSINNGYWLTHKPELDLINKAINMYSRYYSRIHIYDGTLNRPSAWDIFQRVRNYLRKHPNEKPVVIVDYLQILKPINDKDTDKEKVTRSIATFKSVASELGIPVIVISSFNRASYQNPVSMESFKESGEIEYYADTLLGLQYRAIHDNAGNPREHLKEAMQKNPRELELMILKNRNGRSNTNVNFEYIPEYNDFIPMNED